MIKICKVGGMVCTECKEKCDEWFPCRGESLCLVDKVFDCDDCPYKEKAKDGSLNIDKERLINELIRLRTVADLSLKMLKDQEPRTLFMNGTSITVCPICGSVLSKTTHSIPE